MSTVIIEFSPTGGTEKVARIIAGEWGRETTTIDLADSGNDFSASKINESDRVIIAMPVFGGGRAAGRARPSRPDQGQRRGMRPAVRLRKPRV